MTTDDLKAVAEKYPEYLQRRDQYSPSWIALTWLYDLSEHTRNQYQQKYQSAIFSALLDEIAEDLGYYLRRMNDSFTVWPEGQTECTWCWTLDDIKTGEPKGHGDTKLEALLSL